MRVSDDEARRVSRDRSYEKDESPLIDFRWNYRAPHATATFIHAADAPGHEPCASKSSTEVGLMSLVSCG